ncbi:MAG TPA: hypothetical protein PLI09_09735 [Candidatus Hydrogenedentes bacterium]|nr:hypothetical protein [Candidatus Hydrogenedentota bacterium]
MIDSTFDMEDLRQAMIEAEQQERAALDAQAGGGAPEQGATENKSPHSASELPTISAKLPLREQTAQVLDAMAAQKVEAVAVHNGRLVRIHRSRRMGARIEAHTKASLRGVVARCCRIIAVKGDSVHEIIPGDALVEDMLSLPEYPETIKRLDRVIETPTFVEGGRLLVEPGYDGATGIYLWPQKALRRIAVAEEPTDDDVAAALAALDDVICDFPFVDRASKANYIAFWLTVAIRPMIEGCVPALVIDAPQQGTGKGLLSSILSVTATGREVPVQASNGSDEEMRKLITSCLRASAPIIALDNVQFTVHQPSLAAYLTSAVWQDRILRHSRVEIYDSSAPVVINGNNVSIGGDLSRRCVFCRLDPESSRPWERDDFRHKRLMPHVKRRRPEIVQGLLTLARRGIDRGLDYGGPVLGSYESWCQLAGAILASAGIEGFLENRRAVYERADEQASEFYSFLLRWREELGSEPVALREVVARLDPDDLPGSVLSGMSGHGSIVKRLAKLLSRFERRRFGPENIYVVSVTGSANTKRWQVCCDPSKS